MDFINKWKDKIAHKIGDKIQTVKLDIIDKTSGVMGYLLFSLMALFGTLAVLLFVGLGMAEWFAGLLDSRAGGYFATAGIFVLMVGLLFMLSGKVLNAFAGIFIRILTKQEDDDEEEDAEQEKGNK